MRATQRRFFASFVCLAMTSAIGSKPMLCQGLHLKAGPETFIEDVSGAAVPFTSIADVEVTTKPDGLYLTVSVNVDLSGLQGALPGVVQRAANRSDSCDVILNVHTVQLAPAPNSTAALFVGAHGEKWSCPSMTGPQWMGGFPPRIEWREISLGKHKLFEQNGSARISLDIRPTEGGAGIQISPTVTNVDVDGLLGGFLGTFYGGGNALNGLVTEKIRTAISPENLKKSFPVSLAAYSPQITSVRFVDLGAGHLGVSAVLTARLNSTQANALFSGWISTHPATQGK